jgi:HD-GYP domain-containing protein (c-di-GMP phosphodiesterase class II)
MPLEKAVGILKQDADNKKLDPAVVNYLIEFVEDEQRVDTAQNQD